MNKVVWLGCQKPNLSGGMNSDADIFVLSIADALASVSSYEEGD